MEEPQHITLHNGTGGKIYRAGFLTVWMGAHCPVPDATELLLAAYLIEISCLSRITILAEDIIVSKGSNKQRDKFSSSTSTVHLVVDIPTFFNRN